MAIYQDEKQPFLHRIVRALSPRHLVLVLAVIIIGGVYVWQFDGAASIKGDSFFVVVAKLFVTGMIALGVELACEWIRLRDDVSHPLGLRLFHLGLLLVFWFAGFIAALLLWYGVPSLLDW